MNTPIRPGWQTSEFGVLAAFLIQNALVLLVMLGKLNQSEADAVQASLSGIIGSVAVIVAEATALWKFIQARQQIKITQMVASLEAANRGKQEI